MGGRSPGLVRVEGVEAWAVCSVGEYGGAAAGGQAQGEVKFSFITASSKVQNWGWGNPGNGVMRTGITELSQFITGPSLTWRAVLFANSTGFTFLVLRTPPEIIKQTKTKSILPGRQGVVGEGRKDSSIIKYNTYDLSRCSNTLLLSFPKTERDSGSMYVVWGFPNLAQYQRPSRGF